ncbi:hypothetical protein [Marininema halotolerans]|uniref:hypothetical protein n=1 Tax=Marininema halotolerans TaxID=1155944 RepID=UPI0015960557|nr:hypothetical protein [Marininema halotolerans]
MKCGLSGNPVWRTVTALRKSIKGNRHDGDIADLFLGKPTGPKPQYLLERLPL